MTERFVGIENTKYSIIDLEYVIFWKESLKNRTLPIKYSAKWEIHNIIMLRKGTVTSFDPLLKFEESEIKRLIYNSKTYYSKRLIYEESWLTEEEMTKQIEKEIEKKIKRLKESFLNSRCYTIYNKIFDIL